MHCDITLFAHLMHHDVTISKHLMHCASLFMSSQVYGNSHQGYEQIKSCITSSKGNILFFHMT